MKNAYDEMYEKNADFPRFMAEILKSARWFIATDANCGREDRIQALCNCLGEAFKAGIASERNNIIEEKRIQEHKEIVKNKGCFHA